MDAQPEQPFTHEAVVAYLETRGFTVGCREDGATLMLHTLLPNNVMAVWPDQAAQLVGQGGFEVNTWTHLREKLDTLLPPA